MQPADPATLGPISIRISGTTPYKSIREVRWDNVPALAILTGLNGAGKTQLLEYLAYSLTETNPPGGARLTPPQITGDSFPPHVLSFLPSLPEPFGATKLRVINLAEGRKKLLRQLIEKNWTQQDLPTRMRSFKALHYQNDTESDQSLRDDLAFMLDDVDPVIGLPYVFLSHRLRYFDRILQGESKANVESDLGPAPWDVVNDTLSAAGFPFSVTTPDKIGILDTYHLRLNDHVLGGERELNDLSSGEKAILRTTLWLYNAHHSRLPKLLLLDEPDAHLHPSMTRQFLNVVHRVLVQKYGVRVILTTHSPSTVALAPDGSVFEMRKGEAAILSSATKQKTIGLLTSGLVIVSAGTRFVLVEDTDDVEFFETFRDMLTDYGPTCDPMAMEPAPSVVFLPASLGEGKSKVGGGCGIVTQWVEKFDGDPLAEMFRGVIDRDSGNTGTDRVLVLLRYSIENYLLDPLVVFGLLHENDTAPKVPGVSVPRGQEHLLNKLEAGQLQSIVDAISVAVEPKLGTLTAADSDLVEVELTSGVKLKYKGWMLTRRGKDLLQNFQDTFGGPKIITLPRLYQSIRTLRMIPKDLAELMRQLQA